MSKIVRTSQYDVRHPLAEKRLVEQDLESFARDKNEQNTQPSINQKSHSQYHHSSLRKEAAGVGFSNAREVKGRVLAESDECQDGV